MIPMRFGTDEYRSEQTVPITSDGFSGFVFVQVTLSRTTFDGDHVASTDVLEAKGAIETRAGLSMVEWEGADVPPEIADAAVKVAIGEAEAEYEREVEQMHEDLAMMGGAA